MSVCVCVCVCVCVAVAVSMCACVLPSCYIATYVCATLFLCVHSDDDDSLNFSSVKERHEWEEEQKVCVCDV